MDCAISSVLVAAFEAVLAAVKVAGGVRVLADVVAVANVFDPAVADVADRSKGPVAVTLFVAQLERQAFRAVRSFLDLISLEAVGTAIVVASVLSILANVVSVCNVIFIFADVALKLSTSIVRFSHSGLICKLQGLSLVACDSNYGNA